MSHTPTLPGVEALAYPWRKQETIRARDGKRWRLRSILVQDPHALEEMSVKLRTCEWLFYDSEGSGLNPHKGDRICGHTFLTQTDDWEVTAWYVPIRHLATSEVQLSPEVVNPVVAGILAYRQGKVVGHNLKFDAIMLRADDIPVYRQWHDTAIAAITHNENEKSYALKNLGEQYCYAGAKAEAEALDGWLRKDAKRLRLKFKKRGNTPLTPTYLERFGYARTPVRMCGQYACKDVFLTFLLWQKLKWVTQKFNRVYQRDIGVGYYLHDMEWIGLDVRVETIRVAQKAIHAEVEYWLGRIRHLTGRPYFEVKDSNLRRLFFDDLGMMHVKLTEDGQKSVDKESRMLLAKQYPAHEPLITAIDQHAKSRKIESTYAANFLRYVTTQGKIHPVYNQLEQKDEGGVPVTGRLSSAAPNIQNIAKKPYHLLNCACKKCAEKKRIPVGPEITISVRRYFTIKEGWVRAFIDLSQIELRVLAWLSRDPILLDCYANDLDVHQITADEVTGGDRDIAKQVNFGNSYGMTAIGLAKRLPYYAEDPDRAIRDADVYLTKFFETYAGIPRFRDWLAKQMCANGYMFISPFGRPRRIPTIASFDDRERARAERMMMSSIVSGTAADMMKEIMLRSGALIRENDWLVQIVQSVHDEIIYDMPIEGCGKVLPQLMKCFTTWPMFEKGGVPIRASCELSTTTWEEKRAVEVEAESFRWAA